jgi:hypothetical protein
MARNGSDFTRFPWIVDCLSYRVWSPPELILMLRLMYFMQGLGHFIHWPDYLLKVCMGMDMI